MRVFAPAKINLTLQVGRPRPDGMHPVQSVVTFADVGDVIEARAGEGLSLRITGDFAYQLSEDDPENLVLRAARAFAGAARIKPNVSITLEKKLPVASGVGGGSADAAATLRALSSLWSIALVPARMQEIARGLGADVPVCLAGAPAYVTGAGEAWTPMRMPPFAAVLVNPRRGLSTPLVYKEFDHMNLGGDFKPAPAPVWADRTAAVRDIAAIGNALEAPAAALVPEVAEMLDLLRNDARVAHAALSGSGATAFALVDDRHAAARLAADIEAAHPDWWVAGTLLQAA
jgi:4-diphosphocytidyl-2-C-methyl-D-erythritol kinase